MPGIRRFAYLKDGIECAENFSRKVRGSLEYLSQHLIRKVEGSVFLKNPMFQIIFSAGQCVLDK